MKNRSLKMSLAFFLLFVFQAGNGQTNPNSLSYETNANAHVLDLYAKYTKGSSLGNTTFSSMNRSASSDGENYVIVQNYIVQLGAFSKPNMNQLNGFRELGTLFTEEKGNLTIFKLGFYDRMEKAQEVQRIVVQKGYADAVIKTVNVRKKKEEISAQPNVIAPERAPVQQAYSAEKLKALILADLQLIQREITTRARHRITKIITILGIKLNQAEKDRMAVSAKDFYPDQNTFLEIFKYRSVVNIAFISDLTGANQALYNLEANLSELKRSHDAYPILLNGKIEEQATNLRKLILANDNGGLRFAQLLDAALNLDRLISQLN